MKWSRRNFVRLVPAVAASGTIPFLSRGRAETEDVLIRVKGQKVFVTTPEMEVDLVGLGISRIHNKRTGRDYLNTEPALHLILTHTNRSGETKNGLLTESQLAEVRQVSSGEVQIDYKPLETGLPGARVAGRIRCSSRTEGTLAFEADVKLAQPGLTAILHPL